MVESSQSVEGELIRFRIEKRMAGRRDLFLHLLIYIVLAIVYQVNTPPQLPQQYILLGGLWTVPLVLHVLRYYYRCGPGAFALADEIERAMDYEEGGTALDEEEEMHIEERVAKRAAARRVFVAHLLTAALVLGLLWLLTLIWTRPMFNVPSLVTLSQFWGIAAGLHFTRFFFVHGRTPVGRALKIEAEIERRWHLSRERRRARRAELDDEVFVLGESDGRRLRLNAEGEFADGFASEGLREQQSTDG